MKFTRWDNATPETRFFAKVLCDIETGCWNWTAATNGNGYGYFWFGDEPRKPSLAHHFLVGKPAADREWDHLCVNPLCVRPDHLQLVDRQENIRRQRHHGPAPKSACKNGHPFDSANTRILKDGKRVCRICTHEAVKRHRERIKTRAS